MSASLSLKHPLSRRQARSMRCGIARRVANSIAQIFDIGKMGREM